MELKLVRGVVADLMPPEKYGSVACRVGERAVRLHRDLNTAAKAGDEVLVGGELHADVVHVYALKNFTSRKLTQVDFTFHVFGVGLVFVALVFALYFSGVQVSGGVINERALALILFAGGVVGGFLVIRRILRILKLTRWVDEVKE